MSRYVRRRQVASYPRLPLKGSLDLTYRCDNDCRHCWLRLPADSAGASNELTLEEIRRIAGEARSLGCREWTISGGEPMLRPDFAAIFELLTSRSARYTLVTNGTLITPEIARLLKRPGAKLVSLYGATAAVHDGVTRIPGSFEALRRGIALLREAGAGFTVQIVPMKSNIAELEAMIRLAESWSPDWRFGAAWLHLSASGDAVRNREIAAQRLDPEEVARLDPLPLPAAAGPARRDASCPEPRGAGLYAECLASRRSFHIDPYGGLSFCAMAKDPALRADLRTMSFADGWSKALPAMAEAVQAGPEYYERCGRCEYRAECRWCPVYAYLEHRDHSAPVDYLCRAAAAARRASEAWLEDRRRYYRVGGLTLELQSDLPMTNRTFAPKFEAFRVDGPGPAGDVISIRHHFGLPETTGRDLGRVVRADPPWEIRRRGPHWIYRGVYPGPDDGRSHRFIVFNDDHTRASIFNPASDLFLEGGLDSLMLLPSDQILLARVLPTFGGLLVHAAGVDWNGRGLVFAGPSEAGKSTIVKMLAPQARVLCDDRMIVRRNGAGFEAHGTWSHGEVPDVSPGPAPLTGVFFLRQARENRAERIGRTADAARGILPRIVRPLVTADWWDAVMDLVGELARKVPFYDLYFDRSGRVVEILEELGR
jgi:radical SAM protein with 4Fe4S-binding SPASM domain